MSTRPHLLIILAGLSFLMMAACSDQQSTAADEGQSPPSTTAESLTDPTEQASAQPGETATSDTTPTASPTPSEESSADLAALPDQITFTYTDITGLEELQRSFADLQETLSELLGIDVNLRPVANRLAVVEALNAGQVDLVLTGGSEYVAIRALQPSAVPLVGIERPGNFTQIRTHEGSGIESIEGLRGAQIDVIAAGSTSGHLGSAKLLHDNGIDPQTEIEYLFGGSTAGIIALSRGEIDAMALSEDAFTAAVGRAEGELDIDLSDLPVVAEGPLLPPDAFIANGELGNEALDALQAVLLDNESEILDALLAAGDAAAAYSAEGTTFVDIDDHAYDYLRDAYRLVGQDDFTALPE